MDEMSRACALRKAEVAPAVTLKNTPYDTVELCDTAKQAVLCPPGHLALSSGSLVQFECSA